MPLRLEYPLLRQLLILQLFDTAGQSRELLEDPSGCSQVVLTEPDIAPRDDKLEFTARVDVRMGVAAFGGCNELAQWRGAIGLRGTPVVGPDRTSVRLEPETTWLVDGNGTEVTSGQLWAVSDSSLRALLARYTLDLKPHLQSLGDLLPEVLKDRTEGQLQALVNSLRLGDIGVAGTGMDVAIQFTVETLPPDLRTEAALTEAELTEWEERWQMMDALLVLTVKHYASETELQELRNALLDILIDSRYRLRDALTQPPGESEDAVRSWFLDSWQSLDPVVRSIALQQEGQEYLLWFTVLTATDALAALDRVGPAMGLDISISGLRRLARLINGEQGEALMRYSEEVDPELQRLFQQRLQPGHPRPSAWSVDVSPVARAWAAGPAERLNNWAPKTGELDHYLPLVAALLEGKAAAALDKYPLEEDRQRLFHDLVLTTAWQESCWRQYVVKEQKLQPLRSGTGDVGLMQINERVWRGFYDMHRLRWDIDYNSSAGAGILLDYLVKYAIRKGEHMQPGGLSNLARASYSAYNGGPSKVSRYRRSDVSAYELKVDRAFWKKYQQVAAGNEMAVAECLGGAAPTARRLPAAAKSVSSAKTPGRVVAAPTGAAQLSPETGERWVRAQDAQHYTLQLAAFSEPDNALQFIRQSGFRDPTYIYPQQREGKLRYLVLQGIYHTRAASERGQGQFARLETWPRRFGDLY